MTTWMLGFNNVTKMNNTTSMTIASDVSGIAITSRSENSSIS